MLLEERRAFLARKAGERASAMQRAALQIACGVDIAAALSAGRVAREATLLKVGRLLERERLKGLRRHWSYDLNRHIALKQAADRLREAAASEPG